MPAPRLPGQLHLSPSLGLDRQTPDLAIRREHEPSKIAPIFQMRLAQVRVASLTILVLCATLPYANDRSTVQLLYHDSPSTIKSLTRRAKGKSRRDGLGYFERATKSRPT